MNRQETREFRKLQLGLFSKMSNIPEILKKEKSEKRKNDDILLYNASQNFQVMINEQDDEVQQQFTQKKLCSAFCRIWRFSSLTGQRATRKP